MFFYINFTPFLLKSVFWRKLIRILIGIFIRIIELGDEKLIRYNSTSRREDILLTVGFSLRIINHIPVKSRRDDTLLIFHFLAAS
jgi:hypothetical protein